MYSKGKCKLKQMDEALRALRDEARTGLGSSEVRRSAIKAELDALREAKQRPIDRPPVQGWAARRSECGAVPSDKPNTLPARQIGAAARVDADTRMTDKAERGAAHSQSAWLASGCQGVTLDELSDAHPTDASAEVDQIVAALAVEQRGLYEPLRAVAEEYTYHNEPGAAWETALGSSWQSTAPVRTPPRNIQTSPLDDSDDFFLLTQYLQGSPSVASASGGKAAGAGQRRCAYAVQPRCDVDTDDLSVATLYSLPPSRLTTDARTTSTPHGLTRRRGGATAAPSHPPSSFLSASSTASLCLTRNGAGRQPPLSHEGTAVAVNLAENVSRSLQRQVARARCAGERLIVRPQHALPTAPRDETLPGTMVERPVTPASTTARSDTVLLTHTLKQIMLVFCEQCGTAVTYDATPVRSAADLRCANCGCGIQITTCTTPQQDCVRSSCGAISSASAKAAHLTHNGCLSTSTATEDGTLPLHPSNVTPASLSAATVQRWRASLTGLYYLHLRDNIQF